VTALHRAFVLLLLLLGGAGPALSQALTITFFNVGQGDAALVVTPEHRTILIDAGGPAGVTTYLAQLHIDTLDLVIASHAHSDHIGGMAAVLSTYPVRAYLDNDLTHSTTTFRRTLAALERNGAQRLRAAARTITVGSASVRVLSQPPDSGDLRGHNNHSVGVVIEFGEFRALFTGDSERGELAWWLAHDSISQVHVLKLAHHGAANGTTPAWIQRTQAQAVVISVGARNSYGHPAARVVAEWKAAGAQVYRTDQNGTIVIHAQRNGTFEVLRH
jgi:beta-lactamase superfamily II metal-dependent hydrolase